MYVYHASFTHILAKLDKEKKKEEGTLWKQRLLPFSRFRRKQHNKKQVCS